MELHSNCTRSFRGRCNIFCCSSTVTCCGKGTFWRTSTVTFRGMPTIYSMKFNCHFSWQAQYWVMLDNHFFSWQAYFGHVQLSLSVAGAVFGDVGWSFLVADAIFGEFFSTKCGRPAARGTSVVAGCRRVVSDRGRGLGPVGRKLLLGKNSLQAHSSVLGWTCVTRPTGLMSARNLWLCTRTEAAAAPGATRSCCQT